MTYIHSGDLLVKRKAPHEEYVVDAAADGAVAVTARGDGHRSVLKVDELRGFDLYHPEEGNA